MNELHKIQNYCIWEWLHLKALTKRAALFWVPDNEASTVIKVFENTGFPTIYYSPDKLPKYGIEEERGLVFTGVDTESLTLIERRYLQQRQELSYGSEAEKLTRQVGELLGYPTCCTDSFLAIDSKTDDYLVRSSYYKTTKEIDAKLVTFGQFSISAVLHTPCSMHCEASSEIATRVLEAAEKYAPELAKEAKKLENPAVFLSSNRFLRFKDTEKTKRGIKTGGLVFSDEEKQIIDKSWVEQFSKPGEIIDDFSGLVFETEDKKRIHLLDEKHPVKPLLILPKEKTGFVRPIKVLLLETFPNEDPQMLSSVFVKLMAGDILENGIDLTYLSYHPRPGDDDFNESLDSKAIEIIKEKEISQIYLFRTYPRVLVEKIKNEFPDVPRILIDNTTSPKAMEVSHLMPVLDRSRFVSTVINIGKGEFPDYVQSNSGSLHPVWKDYEKLGYDGVMIDPKHPLNLSQNSIRLNDSVKPRTSTFELVSSPGCPYRSDCRTNPVYENLDLDHVPYKFGCSYCTTRTPWIKPIKAEDKIASLCFQLDKLTDEFGGPENIRLIDQGSLGILEQMMEFAKSMNLRGFSWLLDIRVSEVLANVDLIEKLLGNAELYEQKVDLFCIGFENFSDNELQRFNKGVTTKDNEKAIELLEKWSRKFHKSFSKNNAASGFIMFTPWTKIEDLQANLAVFTKHDFRNIRSGAVFTKLRIYPDCPIFELAKHDELLADVYHDDRLNTSESLGYSPEQPWDFKHLQVKRIYNLISPFKQNLTMLNESRLLQVALEYVSENKFRDNEVEDFNEKFGKDFYPEKEENSQADIILNDSTAEKMRGELIEKERSLKDNDSFEARMELASLYVSVDLPQSAIKHFLAAHKKNELHPDPLLRVGELMISLGKKNEAIKILSVAKKRYKDPGFQKRIDKILKSIK